MPKEFFKVDKRIQGIQIPIATNVLKSIEAGLKKSGLMDETENPISPLTEEGLEVLGRNLVYGIRANLSQSEINIPAGFGIDEIALVDSFTKRLGSADISIDGNTLNISFDGSEPIIKSIRTPLDLSKLEPRSDDKPSAFVSTGPKPRITANGITSMPPSVNKKSL